MQQKKEKLIILFLLSFGLNGLQAQQAIPASGGNASGSGGSVSYTIGQMVFTTNTGTNGSVAQGVQQPYEISEVTGIKAAMGIALYYSVYPNPTSDNLILKIDAPALLNIQSLSYQLYDMNGKLLESKRIEANETWINMSNYLPAIYLLKISHNNKKVKTFKITQN